MLGFPLDAAIARSVLAIGCHADDVEIGCGGMLLELVRRHPSVEVTWVTLAAEGARGDEARASAERFLAGAERTQVELHGFRDAFFPYDGAEIKQIFEDLKRRLEPSLVLTHTRNDLHQDHRLVCELTWNTFRDHLILEYEIPKFDGDLASPNLFVPLPATTAERKVELLVDGFPSQAAKDWFDRDVFLSLMRIRGMECRAESGYAEAFTCRKLVIGA